MASDRRDPRAELPLHPLELRILLVLSERAAHGYDIVREIEEKYRYGAVYPANLYRRIRELRDRGLIVEVDGPSGDDRRRYLSVTPFGRRVARAEAVRLEELLRDARVVLQPARG